MTFLDLGVVGSLIYFDMFYSYYVLYFKILEIFLLQILSRGLQAWWLSENALQYMPPSRALAFTGQFAVFIAVRFSFPI